MLEGGWSTGIIGQVRSDLTWHHNGVPVVTEVRVRSSYYAAEVLKLEQDQQVPAYLQRIVRCSNFRSDSSVALHHYRLYSRGTPRRQSQIPGVPVQSLIFPESAPIPAGIPDPRVPVASQRLEFAASGPWLTKK